MLLSGHTSFTVTFIDQPEDFTTPVDIKEGNVLMFGTLHLCLILSVGAVISFPVLARLIVSLLR